MADDSTLLISVKLDDQLTSPFDALMAHISEKMGQLQQAAPGVSGGPEGTPGQPAPPHQAVAVVPARQVVRREPEEHHEGGAKGSGETGEAEAGKATKAAAGAVIAFDALKQSIEGTVRLLAGGSISKAIGAFQEIKAFEDIGEASEKAAEHGSALASVLTKLGPVAAAAGAAFAVTAGSVYELAKASAETVTDIKDLSNVSGLSTEKVVALQTAMQQAGGSGSSITSALRGLGLQIQEQWGAISDNIRDAADRQISSVLRIRESYRTYADALDGIKSAAIDAASAQDRLSDAQSGVKNSKFDTEQADIDKSRAIIRWQAFNGQAPDPERVVQLNRREELLKLKRAEERADEAPRREREAESTEQKAELEPAQAQRRLEAAQDNVTKAAVGIDTTQTAQQDERRSSIPEIIKAIQGQPGSVDLQLVTPQLKAQAIEAIGQQRGGAQGATWETQLALGQYLQRVKGTPEETGGVGVAQQFFPGRGNALGSYIEAVSNPNRIRELQGASDTKDYARLVDSQSDSAKAFYRAQSNVREGAERNEVAAGGGKTTELAVNAMNTLASTMEANRDRFATTIQTVAGGIQDFATALKKATDALGDTAARLNPAYNKLAAQPGAEGKSLYELGEHRDTLTSQLETERQHLTQLRVQRADISKNPEEREDFSRTSTRVNELRTQQQQAAREYEGADRNVLNRVQDQTGERAEAARGQSTENLIQNNLQSGARLTAPTEPAAEHAASGLRQTGDEAVQAAGKLHELGTAASEAHPAAKPAEGHFLGGPVIIPPGHADGGMIRGPGTGTSDSIFRHLSEGDFVIKASSTAKLGHTMLDRINAGTYSDGGEVPAFVSDGEYHVNSSAVQKYGLPFMHMLNASGHAEGGEISDDDTREKVHADLEQRAYGIGGLPDPDGGAHAATMSTYTPTLSERIGHAGEDAAAGLGASRSYSSSFGEGLRNVAGLIPGVGQAVSAYDAGREGAAGNYGGAALAALGALPMAGAAGKAGKEVEEGITAYHGSPHSFTKFDSSKIGEGEGAQSFGHGLYFAQREGVARSYRDRLSGVESHAFDGHALTSDAAWAAASRNLAKSGDANTSGVLADFRSSGADKKGFLDQQRYMYKDDPDQLAALDKFDKLFHEGGTTGHMYQVKIAANPDHFLDWNKTLDQQPHVRSALGYPDAPPPTEDHYALINKLQAQGVKGNDILEHPEYKDMLTALQRKATLPNGEEERVDRISGDYLWNSWRRANNYEPEAAAEALYKAGIPGIKYLDQGSRGKDEAPTHNYVVFNDKNVEILKKYGMAGLMAGAGGAGVAAQAAGADDQQPQTYARGGPVLHLADGGDGENPWTGKHVGKLTDAQWSGIKRSLDVFNHRRDPGANLAYGEADIPHLPGADSGASLPKFKPATSGSSKKVDAPLSTASQAAANVATHPSVPPGAPVERKAPPITGVLPRQIGEMLRGATAPPGLPVLHATPEEEAHEPAHTTEGAGALPQVHALDPAARTGWQPPWAGTEHHEKFDAEIPQKTGQGYGPSLSMSAEDSKPWQPGQMGGGGADFYIPTHDHRVLQQTDREHDKAALRPAGTRGGVRLDRQLFETSEGPGNVTFSNSERPVYGDSETWKKWERGSVSAGTRLSHESWDRHHPEDNPNSPAYFLGGEVLRLAPRFAMGGSVDSGGDAGSSSSFSMEDLSAQYGQMMTSGMNPSGGYDSMMGSAASDISSSISGGGSSPSSLSGFHALDITTDYGKISSLVSEAAISSMRSSALDARLSSTGNKPGWYGS